MAGTMSWPTFSSTVIRRSVSSTHLSPALSRTAGTAGACAASQTPAQTISPRSVTRVRIECHCGSPLAPGLQPQAVADNRSVSVAEHKAHAPESVRCFVLTISDTRTLETETSGKAIAELLTARHHIVAG